MTETISLTISWAAYTNKAFDSIYNGYANKLGGYRPNFRVTHGGKYAEVITTTADAHHVRAIIAEAEAAAA